MEPSRLLVWNDLDSLRPPERALMPRSTGRRVSLGKRRLPPSRSERELEFVGDNKAGVGGGEQLRVRPRR
jgi:hypothetical protein